jgi:RNAse (barnase) inhibitor barstar
VSDTLMSKPVFEIDGRNFDTFAGFVGEVTKSLSLDSWGQNLDAFNDILRGGFGTPQGGFVLRWINSERSRVALGYDATVKYLEQKLQRCHPDSVAYVSAELDAARSGEGQTLFDIVLEIIRVHGAGGEEQGDGIELELR